MPRKVFSNVRDELVYRFLDLIRSRRDMTPKSFHEAHMVLRSAAMIAGYALPSLEDEDAIVRLDPPVAAATEILKEAQAPPVPLAEPPSSLLSDLQEKS